MFSFASKAIRFVPLPALAAIPILSKTDGADVDQAPKSAKLVQTVYVTRHGLRTPLSESDPVVRLLPFECLSEEETNDIFTHGVELYRAQLKAERASKDDPLIMTRLPPGQFDAEYPEDKKIRFGLNCHGGQLTKIGHKQMRAVGVDVGKRYIEELGLLGTEFTPSEISVRSTNIHRTVETAYEIVTGMYPNKKEPLRVDLLHPKDENMYPRAGCAFLGGLWDAFKHSPEKKAIRQELYESFEQSKFTSREESKYWSDRMLPAVCNTVATVIGHGFDLPSPALTYNHLDITCNLSSKEYYAVYAEPRVTRLAIGRFLGDIADILKKSVDFDQNTADSTYPNKSKSKPKDDAVLDPVDLLPKNPAKFNLLSGHDNTIAPLLVSLGLPPEHPPMASGLAFELYKANSKSQPTVDNPHPDYFVQLLYNFEPVALPKCGNKLMCPYDEWMRIVQTRIPTDYHHECETYEKQYQFYYSK